DLARADPLRLKRLEAVGAEVERRAALGLAVDAALVRLAELRAFRLQHGVYPRNASGARAGALTALAVAPAAAAAFLHVERAPLRSHRIMLDDLALVDPDLHPDDAVGGPRQAVAEIDVGAQGMER